jgi:hypothetical protein
VCNLGTCRLDDGGACTAHPLLAFREKRMNAEQVIVLLILTLPVLLVSLGIALWRHEFPGIRFIVASLGSAVGGIIVGGASAQALNITLSMISPGFPGIGGAFILLGFGEVMAVVMGIAVGMWFPTNPPKTSKDLFNPAGCTAIMLLVVTFTLPGVALRC